jgi:hypothetical protein
LRRKWILETIEHERDIDSREDGKITIVIDHISLASTSFQPRPLSQIPFRSLHLQLVYHKMCPSEATPCLWRERWEYNNKETANRRPSLDGEHIEGEERR